MFELPQIRGQIFGVPEGDKEAREIWVEIPQFFLDILGFTSVDTQPVTEIHGENIS